MRGLHLPTILTLILLASCGAQDSSKPISAETQLVPAAITGESPAVEIFNAALPDEGNFAATRVPAVSQLTKSGAQFHEASTNVSISDTLAQFEPQGTIDYAIWRFNATPQDSIGQVKLAIADADTGSRYWTAIADYSNGRWDWIGSAADGAGFEDFISGNQGQHSSPAGHIYVAVLSDSDVAFSVESVTIEYLERFNVSGTVTDMDGNPLAGALVTTNLEDPTQVFSGPDGSFTLNGIPNGSWAVMATLEDWVQPLDGLQFTLDGADLDNVQVRLMRQTWGFGEVDPHEPNDERENAYKMSGNLLSGGYISAFDDESDHIEFEVPAQGWYYLELRVDETVLFPWMQLYLDYRTFGPDSSTVLSGMNWLGYYFPEAGSYFAQVACEAGGGGYELEIISGDTSQMNGKLVDSGLPGDGGDGLAEELANTVIELDMDGELCLLLSENDGDFRHEFLPQRPIIIRPKHPNHTFNPPSLSYDFTNDDLLNLDFNISTTVPTDLMEPNDDFGSATVLNLPLTDPVQGWLGGMDATGNDEEDWFRFNVSEGMHVYAGLVYTGHDPVDRDEGAYLSLRDSSDKSVNCHDGYSETGSGIRSREPLSAGVYYLQASYSGDLRNYSLQVFEFEARSLTVDMQVKETPLDHGSMHWRSLDGIFHDSEDIEAGECFIELPLYGGEVLLLSYEAFGLAFNPQQQWVEIADSDVTVSNSAEFAGDQLESNDSEEGAWKLAGITHEIVATASEESDSSDYYLLTELESASLQLTVETEDPDNRLNLQLESTDESMQHAGFSLRDGDIWYAPIVGGHDYYLRVTGAQGEGAYRLLLEKSEKEIFRIHGTVDHGKPGESYGELYVFNHTTGRHTRLFSPSYDLGYHPPGEYEVEFYISNHDVTPAGKVLVEVEDQDVQLDFSASYNNADFGEPNSTRSTPAAISLPADLNASTDFSDTVAGENDYVDFYSFTAATSGVIEILVTPWRGEPLFLFTRLEDVPLTTVIANGQIIDEKGVQLIRHPVVAGEDYIIQVNSASDLEYNLTAEIQ